MAINFVQETGTASSLSTSYASIAQYKQYWLDRNVSISDPDDAIKAYLNIATDFIDSTYKFMGEIVNVAQALSFPRVGVITRNGVVVDSDSIPTGIIAATCYLAYEAKNNNLMRASEGIKSISYGPVSKTFNRDSDSIYFPMADKYLRPFIVSGCQMLRVN